MLQIFASVRQNLISCLWSIIIIVKYLKYFNNKSYDFLYMVKLIERFIEVYNSQTYFYEYVHLGVKDNAGRGMYIFSGQLVALTWLYPGTRGGHWTQGQAPAHSQARCLVCTHTSWHMLIWPEHADLSWRQVVVTMSIDVKLINSRELLWVCCVQD